MSKTTAAITAKIEQEEALRKRAKQAKRNQPEREWLAELEARVDRLEVGNRLSRSVCVTLAEAAGKHASKIGALEARIKHDEAALSTFRARIGWLLFG